MDLAPSGTCCTGLLQIDGLFRRFAVRPLLGGRGRGQSMRGKWILFIAAVVVVSAAVAILVGRAREATRIEQMEAELRRDAARPGTERVDFQTFADLPPPVVRYFRHVLTDGQAFIAFARTQQTGELRTDTTTEQWSQFSASHTVVPPATGFLWDARIRAPLATHVRVIDSYIDGVGSGRVSLLSALAVASEAGVPELNSGALHRYLAEAVWYPTALLPQSGVVWSAIDDDSARATLTVRDTTVSLEFRFNELDEVTGIYSEGRFGSFEGGYRRVPWQGHFRDYQVQKGMRVPRYGEVGWYDDGALELVWKGHIVSAEYRFEQ